MANRSAEDTSQGCPIVIKESLFDLGCLPPALVIIFILAFVKQRVKCGLQNCNGYPGLLIPFDFLSGFGNRFTIAVMFGATSSTCLNMFLQPRNGIFQMPDPAGWVQEFATVLLWMLGPWGHPHPAVYLISACIVPPCARVVFAVL